MNRLDLIHKLPDGIVVTPKAESILSRRNVKADGMVVTPLNRHGEYRVTCEDTDALVDLDSKRCDCRKFQLSRIPCRHAIACCEHAGKNMYEMCSDYYKM